MDDSRTISREPYLDVLVPYIPTIVRKMFCINRARLCKESYI